MIHLWFLPLSVKKLLAEKWFWTFSGSFSWMSKLTKYPKVIEKNHFGLHIFKEAPSEILPRRGQEKKNYWVLVSSSSWVGFLICRSQNNLLSTARNALMFATGTVQTNPCMVKFWRYRQEKGVLKYHTLYRNRNFIAISALEMKLQNSQNLHLC